MSSATVGSPVVVVCGGDTDGTQDVREAKRAKTERARTFRPGSAALLDNMLHPLSREDFLNCHFRKSAVHIQRRASDQERKALVERICSDYLFDLDARRIFEETSSENVFLWLRPSTEDGHKTTTLNSVEIADPDTAHALHVSGNHPAYCRAPPPLERRLVGPLLRATGLGGGHYHPPHAEAVTLGGNTTLGRGEVELFIGAPSSSSASGGNVANGDVCNGNKGNEKQHTTGWHTDFQENFTIQLSGVKRWTLRRGRVRHPVRATTPHYAREGSVVENQLKLARLSCLGGNAVRNLTPGEVDATEGPYGFEYGDNNAYGPEETIVVYPGDVLYFPSGMWHRVESIEPGVSLNVSLMGTTYATLVAEALQHLMVGSDERWREIVTSRPGDDGTQRLQGLLNGLSGLVERFVNEQGGARSLLPPALSHPLMSPQENENDEGVDSDGDMSEPMDEQAEDEPGTDDDDEVPSSAIIVDMDSFEGPHGWASSIPPTAQLVKNPLASLIAMPDITGRPDNADATREARPRRYILNVNYAGNDMIESHVRVVLETTDPAVTSRMSSYIASEAAGQDPVREQAGLLNTSPGLCLLYYGYLAWNETSQMS
ncbi:hypothetical protein ACHAXT_012144 [Thalassiosira profunda]